uniref:BZIP domain-containing protein n=1 Tax=Caenorhabditis japonica TaxID=281687 RepID=A0A8R1IBG1_CAEJA
MATRCTANVFIKDEIKEEQLEEHLEIDLSAILNSHDSSPDEDEADLHLNAEMFLAASSAADGGGGGGAEGIHDIDVEELLKSGMGLAAAQQQLKARNKMHEMALRQHLITDQVSADYLLQNLQANGELVLSSEERRTLVQEGYPIPQKYPLSKSEEEALKIVRRKIKNKLSAQESRRKRKEYIDALESRLHVFSEENKTLKLQVHQLEASNRDLQQKLHQYEGKDKM